MFICVRHTFASGRVISDVSSLSIADVDLLVVDSKRVLSVTLNRRLTFDDHASAVAEAPASPEQRGAYCSGSASTLSSTFVLAQGLFYHYIIPDFDIVIEDVELW